MNRMNMMAAAMVGMAALILGACSSGGTKNAAGYEEKRIVHQVTAADLDTAKSTEPVKADNVVLWVNGMGCPLCATSIDKQLERLPGVTGVKVDLANGFVDVAMAGAKRPSPHDFSESVIDAGFTLVKVELK